MKKYLQKNSGIKYSDHWSTPDEIYDLYVNKLGYYDPCPLYKDDFDFKMYGKNIFLNLPYSDIKKWIDWAILNHNVAEKNIETVILMPSRTDTKYFHKLLEYGIEIEFIKGRLKFGNHKKSAPFPSIIVRLLGKSNKKK